MAQDIKYILSRMDGNIRLEDFDIDWYFYAYRLRCTTDYLKQRVIDRLMANKYYGEIINSEMLYRLKADIIGLLKDFIWNQDPYEGYGIPYNYGFSRSVLPIDIETITFEINFDMGPTLPKNNICACKACGITNEYAEPNQIDGTYVCYNCR